MYWCTDSDMAWSLCSFSQSRLTRFTRLPKVDGVISSIGTLTGTSTPDAVSPFTMATTWILSTWWHPMQRKQGHGWRDSDTWWRASVMRTHWPKGNEPMTNILYMSRGVWMGGGMEDLVFWLVVFQQLKFWIYIQTIRLWVQPRSQCKALIQYARIVYWFTWNLLWLISV